MHVDPYYYTPMRFYYMPERPHFLLASSDKKLNWRAIPGYAAMLPEGGLERLGPVLVIDPSRTLFPHRYGTATGRQLSAVRWGDVGGARP